MKRRRIIIALIISILLFGAILGIPCSNAQNLNPYISISGTINFVTGDVAVNGRCENGTIVLVNKELLDIPSSGKFSTEMRIKEANYITIATPSGKSLRITFNFPQMPASLIKALPKLNFSFNTKDMILQYGGTMKHKPKGKVVGYVYNDANNKKTSFVVNEDNSFNSTLPLSFGKNTIHSYARYLYFLKFTVPDFSVDFKQAKVLKLKIGSPYMYVNGIKKEVDPGRGTTPVILKGWNRTLLPVRAVAEGLGGKVGWDGKERKVTIDLGNNRVALWIGKNIAEVNGNKMYIDSTNHKVKPIIINDRTMLPVRFVAESLGAYVKWYGKTREVLVVYPE